MSILKQSYLDALTVLQTFCENELHFERTETISRAIAESIREGGKPIICGNGGSTCDAMHFEEEFTGRYRKNRRPLPAISISNPGHITCVANDYGYDDVFSRGVEAHGKAGDVFIGLSTSGNSKNIIHALDKAKEIGMKTVCLLGKDGGALKGKSDHEFVINERTADRIQEVHMLILHVIIEGVERQLFPELY